MPKGKPLSAAHKAAISAGLKRYHAGRGGGSSSGRAKRTTSGRRGSPTNPVIGVPQFSNTPAPKPPGRKSNASREIKNIDTGKPISREAAAAIMFGTKGAAKKLAAAKKRKGSVKR